MGRLGKIVGWGSAGVVVIGAAAGLGIWGGYTLNTELQNRFSYPAQIEYKLQGYYNAWFKSDEPEVERLITNRAILDMETVFLPAFSSDFAGGITVMPTGEVLVVDRLGQLSFVRDGKTTKIDVASADNRAAPLREQLAEGLLGQIEIDFNWFRYNDILYVEDAGQGYLLLSYTEWNPDDLCFGSALARIAVDGADPAGWHGSADDWDVIARTEPCLRTFTSGKGIYGLEAGGRMDLLSGTKIVWSAGSYERDDRYEGTDFSDALAQTDSGDYGKVMEIDFMTGAKRTIAKGLRNPQGVSVGSDGQIWVSDHGMRGGDELNLVQEGRNFGFPAVSYGTHYDRHPAGNGPTHQNHEGYDKPVIAFVPSIAPASALAVRDFVPEWNGDVLVGALSGAIWRVHVEDERAAYAEPIELGMRIRDLARVGPGKIVAYTDDRRLIFLSPSEAVDPTTRLDEIFAEAVPDEETRAAVGSTLNACLQCHGVMEGEHGAGPSLYHVCGREPGSTDFDGYSGQLAAVTDAWDVPSLSSFVADTEGTAPGTTMPWGGIEDPAVATGIAKVLCEF